MASAPWSTQRLASSGVSTSLTTNGRPVIPFSHSRRDQVRLGVPRVVDGPQLFQEPWVVSQVRQPYEPRIGADLGRRAVHHVPALARRRHAHRVEPGLRGGRHDVLGHLVVAVVELAPQRPGRGPGDLAERVVATHRQRHPGARRARRSRDRQLAVGMSPGLAAGRRRHHRKADGLAEYGRRLVADAHVPEDAVAQQDGVEGLAVAADGQLVRRAARYRRPGVRVHALVGERLHLEQVDGVHRVVAHPSSWR